MVTFLDIFDNLLKIYEFLEQKDIYLDENNNFKIYVISCMKGHINKKEKLQCIYKHNPHICGHGFLE